MRLIGILALTVAVFVLAPAASADTVYVWQESSYGAGDFFANPVGTIEVFTTSSTLADFYNYYDYSYHGEVNGGPVTVTDLTQLFLVEASDGLAFVQLNDLIDDGSGGRTDTVVTLWGDSAAYVLLDDPGGDVSANAAGTEFQATRRWQPCCTDGFALGWLEGYWSLLVDFVPTSGIDAWRASSSDGANLPLALGNDHGRVLLSPIPEPGTLLLLGAGLLGLVIRRRRRR